jgi:hypothetical protein
MAGESVGSHNRPYELQSLDPNILAEPPFKFVESLKRQSAEQVHLLTCHPVCRHSIEKLLHFPKRIVTTSVRAIPPCRPPGHAYENLQRFLLGHSLQVFGCFLVPWCALADQQYMGHVIAVLLVPSFS